MLSENPALHPVENASQRVHTAVEDASSYVRAHYTRLQQHDIEQLQRFCHQLRDAVYSIELLLYCTQRRIPLGQLI